MGVSLQTIIQHMEDLAPPEHAQSWDKCGLQIGDRQSEVNSLLIALDVSEQVIAQAIKDGVELIIAHHPLIFAPLTSLTRQNPTANLTRQLIQANINLYIAHTNLDASPYGATNYLAGLLGLTQKKPLAAVMESQYKLVTFVPNNNLESVRKAIGDAGAGVIGKYSHCAFYGQGKGFFKSGDDSSPCIGKPGQFSTVDEIRLETVVSEANVNKVIAALIKAHPYQEVAYDIYPLKSHSTERGLGMVGKLLKPLKLIDIAEKLKNSLNLQGLRWIGSADQKITKIATCGGSGADLMVEAKKSGAQLLITGDVKYHQACQAQTLGIAILDIGHFACEYMAMGNLAKHMQAWFANEKKSVIVSTCKQEASPFHYYSGESTR